MKKKIILLLSFLSIDKIIANDLKVSLIGANGSACKNVSTVHFTFEDQRYMKLYFEDNTYNIPNRESNNDNDLDNVSKSEQGYVRKWCRISFVFTTKRGLFINGFSPKVTFLGDILLSGGIRASAFSDVEVWMDGDRDTARTVYAVKADWSNQVDIQDEYFELIPENSPREVEVGETQQVNMDVRIVTIVKRENLQDRRSSAYLSINTADIDTGLTLIKF